MSAKNEVREASDSFYAALNSMLTGDAASMADVWSHGEACSTLHPIGGRDLGWEAVRDSFDKVAGLASDGSVSLRDRIIHADGGMAYEIGVEKGTFTLAGHLAEIEHRVTNVYRREAGGWKIVHHHTDISPAMLDILAKLK